MQPPQQTLILLKSALPPPSQLLHTPATKRSCLWLLLTSAHPASAMPSHPRLPILATLSMFPMKRCALSVPTTLLRSSVSPVWNEVLVLVGLYKCCVLPACILHIYVPSNPLNRRISSHKHSALQVLMPSEEGNEELPPFTEPVDVYVKLQRPRLKCMHGEVDRNSSASSSGWGRGCTIGAVFGDASLSGDSFRWDSPEHDDHCGRFACPTLDVQQPEQGTTNPGMYLQHHSWHCTFLMQQSTECRFSTAVCTFSPFGVCRRSGEAGPIILVAVNGKAWPSGWHLCSGSDWAVAFGTQTPRVVQASTTHPWKEYS